MRIGINALYLIPGGVGGTEIYLRSLLTALAAIDRENEYFVFTNAETGADITPAAPNFRTVPQRVRARNRPARILWEQLVLPLALVRRRIDVLFNPGFTAPLVAGRRQVTVFHDLQHKRHPEYFRWFDLPFWNFLLWSAAHRSQRLIAVSEATRTDLLKCYSLPESKVRVIGHGVDEAFFAIGQGPRAEQPLLLTVSTLHPHKNLDRLLQAFSVFAPFHPGYRLVVAGLRGFHTEQLEAERDSLGLKERVTFTGWIPREELYDLFAQARAFLYPSRFEGFGMPVLEALAAGLPTGCSNREPMAGIARDAALLFDPDSPQAIRTAMERLTSDEDLRAKLRVAGPARAREFTWERAARETLRALTEN